MWLLLVLCLSVVIADPLATCPNSVVPASFTYTVVGKTTTTPTGYLIRTSGSGSISASGSSITVSLGPRFYLATACASSFGTGSNLFSAVNVATGSISFTVDVSQVGCGLNAAFYLVSMPAASGGGSGDYYCDANCVGGNCCPEMDLFEANRHAIQITPHRCTGTTSGCDGSGCAKNTQSINNGFGPASTYTINSLSSFNVKITFTSSSITSVISQGSKSITLTHGGECGSTYLSDFSKSLTAGMVPVWSYWQGGMSWLDGPACSSDTPEVQGNWIFSNLVITGTVATAAGPPPPPPPAPVPPGSITCGQKGTSNNIYWIEFTVPSSINGASTAASVTCTGTYSGTYSCGWFSAGNKYQCNCGGGCSTPSVTVGGKHCILDPNSAALSDESASYTSSGSTQSLIIGLSASLAIAILIIVIVVAFIIYKVKNGNFI